MAYARVDLVPGWWGPCCSECEGTDCFLSLAYGDGGVARRLVTATCWPVRAIHRP